jgi:hypothetical protein
MIMSYELGKSVPIKLYRGKCTYPAPEHREIRDEIDQMYDGRVGVSADGEVFGLVDGWSLPYELENARLTHMAYRLDKYFQPADVIARMREGEFTGRFLFNAGGMGMSALWAEVDDLERAFRELGLL